MASSVIKKNGFGALEDLGSGSVTVTQDGLYTLIGIPNSGYTGDTVIRVKVTSGTIVYGAGCQSSLGVNPCVTIPVRKGDILLPDYAFNCSLQAYFSPIE